MKASIHKVCSLAQIIAENIVSLLSRSSDWTSGFSGLLLSIRPSIAPAETTHNPFILHSFIH